MNTQQEFPNNLFDKDGNRVKADDVIFEEKNYFRVYWNEKQPQVEAFSPSYGYIHNLTAKDILRFKRIGTFEEAEHLMVVD
ncbi:MAG: hypothetical protein FWH23_06195 [Bacteroidales bacterium]|nr:hypothetical protein [Bacteroidales bacterium]